MCDSFSPRLITRFLCNVLKQKLMTRQHLNYSVLSYSVTEIVDAQAMGHIANEDKWQEYVPINLGNWDTSDLRTISTQVGEKELYDKYYPYTSGYIHANWGAVREASFQMCLNPLHRMHRIPRFGLPVLPNSTEDCRYLVNKIFELVDELYPSFKDRIEGAPIHPKGGDTN